MVTTANAGHIITHQVYRASSAGSRTRRVQTLADKIEQTLRDIERTAQYDKDDSRIRPG